MMRTKISSPIVGEVVCGAKRRKPEGGDRARRARRSPHRLAEFILRPRLARTGGLGTPHQVRGRLSPTTGEERNAQVYA
jgi:hypothetical protein